MLEPLDDMLWVIKEKLDIYALVNDEEYKEDMEDEYPMLSVGRIHEDNIYMWKKSPLLQSADFLYNLNAIYRRLNKLRAIRDGTYKDSKEESRNEEL